MAMWVTLFMTDRMKTKRHTTITSTWNGMKCERSVCNGGLVYNPPQAAADDLERAMKIEPNEPNTVLLMGQVCRAMGKLAQAMQMMTIARDLDPKNAQKINRMIEAFKAESSKAPSFGGTGGFRVGGTAGNAIPNAIPTLNGNGGPVQNRGGMLAGAGGYAGGDPYGDGASSTPHAVVARGGRTVDR